MKTRKVVLTGGHHTSALIIAKALRQKGAKAYWFGHKYTMKGAKNLSAEYKEVAGANIPFYSLLTGKFHKATPVDYLKLPMGFLQSFYLLLKIRPSLIFSFGGYLAVPVVLAGWVFGIPSVTHEQTATAGRANRLLKHFAKKVFITFKSSAKFFPKEKTILTGLPLLLETPSLLPVSQQASPLQLGGDGSPRVMLRPTILITGGKQGSHTINKAIESILPNLLQKYNLIHQAGETSFTKDLNRLKKRKEKLPAKLKKRYQVFGYVKNKAFTKILQEVDLAISRAGAHTVYKFLYFKKKAILIPFPFSFAQEQQKNAEILQKVGLGEILPQKELSGKKLLDLIEKLLKKKISKEQFKKADRLIIPGATEKILKEISTYVI